MHLSAPEDIAKRIATASVVCPGLVPPITTTCRVSRRRTASSTLFGIVPETGIPESDNDSLTIVAFSLVAAMPILSRCDSSVIIGLASSIPSLAGAPPPTTIPILSFIETLSLITDISPSSQPCLSSISGRSRLPPSATITVVIDYRAGTPLSIPLP